jgi:hypothetical protein
MYLTGKSINRIEASKEGKESSLLPPSKDTINNLSRTSSCLFYTQIDPCNKIRSYSLSPKAGIPGSILQAAFHVCVDTPYLFTGLIMLHCSYLTNLYCKSVPGFGLRALSLLGRCSTIWTMSLGLFALLIFQMRSCIFAQASLDHNPPTSGLLFSCDDRCTPPCLACWLRSC